MDNHYQYDIDSILTLQRDVWSVRPMDRGCRLYINKHKVHAKSYGLIRAQLSSFDRPILTFISKLNHDSLEGKKQRRLIVTNIISGGFN